MLGWNLRFKFLETKANKLNKFDYYNELAIQVQLDLSRKLSESKPGMSNRRTEPSRQQRFKWDWAVSQIRTSDKEFLRS